MKITRREGSDFFVVSVDKDEVEVASGRKLPYPTWIGTIDANSGKLNVWTPAAYVPRGYKAAATALLEQAREQLQSEGKVRKP